ncbi:hypothetical protein JZU48_04950, partial [bacterium]|nr:hypothetical protein [bacterium]
MSVLSNVRVGARVAIGFSLLLGLTLVASASALLGLQAVGTSVSQLDWVAHGTVTVQEIRADALELRQLASDYAVRGDSGLVARIAGVRKEVAEDLDAAERREREPRRLEMIRGLKTLSGEYGGVADRIIDQRRRRDKVIETEMMPNGLKAAEKLGALLVAGTEDGDGIVAGLAGFAQQEFLSARLASAHFLETPKAEVADEARKRLKASQTTSMALLKQLQNDAWKKLVEESLTASQAYGKALDTVVAASLDLERLRADGLERLGAGFAQAVEQLQENQTAALD